MQKLLLIALTISTTLAAKDKAVATAVTPDQAFEKLVQGNHRYVNSHLSHPHQNKAQRMQVAQGQHPYACVLSCSDSRVPPELVFDAGLGDVFVVRVAGNIADEAITGSIEYAAEHLHVPLIVVMGHTKCGAVTAAVQGVHPLNHIDALVNAIMPAVNTAKHEDGDLLNNSIRENVRHTVEVLRTSHPVLAEEYAHHKVNIVGAIYDLESGKVTFLK